MLRRNGNMKPAGCLCKIDTLGRIVIPANVRKKYELSSGDSIEIFTQEDGIVLKKYNPACIFCGGMEEITNFNGKVICKKCVKRLAEAVK